MNKGFFKFIAKVVLIFSLFLLLDGLSGWILTGMLSKISNQGDTGKTYFALNDVNTPIVVVGSSRASHHYVSSIIEDSLGLPVYNVGRDGCFFTYNCCVINSIFDRYTPKLLIWENGSNYLFDSDSDPLENLYPYYNRNKWVKKAINDEVEWDEQVKLRSNLYQYNSSVHKILLRFMTRSSFVDQTLQGYYPLQPKVLNEPLRLQRVEALESEISVTKQQRMEAVLKRAKEVGTKLIVVDSPIFAEVSSNSNDSANLMRELCLKYGAVYLDNRNMSLFLEHPEYFNDVTHLNDPGAQIYTSLFLQQIKGLI